MNNNFFKIALLGAVLVSQPLDAKEIDKNTAKLQAMNKLTGRVSVIDVPVNGEVEFGSFSIVVRSCKTRPPEETPDNFAFVDVVDKHEDGSLLNIFKGWMVSSSPALNAVAHPIYDVWLLQCVDTEVDKNKLLSDDELLKRDEIPMKQQETASDGDDAAKGGIEDVLDVEISPMPAALQEDHSQPLDEKIQTNDEMTSSTEENASENQEKKQTVEKSEAVSVEPAVSEDEKLKVFFTQESDEDENNDGKPETLIFEPSLDTPAGNAPENTEYVPYQADDESLGESVPVVSDNVSTDVEDKNVAEVHSEDVSDEAALFENSTDDLDLPDLLQ